MNVGLCSVCFGASGTCDACEYDHEAERRVSHEPLDDAETVVRIGEIAERIRTIDDPEAAHRIEDALTRAVLREVVASCPNVGPIPLLERLLRLLEEPRVRWFA